MRNGLPSLEDLLALPPAVALSLVVSLDGQLCGPDGSSRSISGAEDLDWLKRLRAASDAILVGARTAEVEGYRTIRVHGTLADIRRAHGFPQDPDLVILHRQDDIETALARVGPRVLLEAGVRLHTVLAPLIDRVWISHAPTVVGDTDSAFALPMEDFTLVDRWVGEAFVVSRFERDVSRLR